MSDLLATMPAKRGSHPGRRLAAWPPGSGIGLVEDREPQEVTREVAAEVVVACMV